jgi:CubicO group peptidase (beta-lactamase class C family)
MDSMRCVLSVVLVSVLFLTSAIAQQETEARVDQVFAAYNKQDSPGCALGVIRNGDFLYRRAYGMASLELGVPLSPSSVFYMGSVSKQFTAASIVLAAEQGFLSLDDDVRKYIPELPDYGHVITLRQMLHHTSGLRDFLSLLAFSGRDGSEIHSEAELIDLIARQKALNNLPGAQYIYSNTNYFLLGVVIRRATGKSLAQFATDSIFYPLGMTHTHFYDDHSVVLPGRVSAYAPNGAGSFLVDWSTDYDIVGGGGLTSSVDDLLLWDRNFYANKLGKGTLIQQLETRGTLNSGRQISYALGLEIQTYRGLPVVEHGGALYGYRTEILRFPEQRFTVICLCNVSNADTTNLARKVADMYLADSLQPAPNTQQTSAGSQFPDPAPFAGRYLDPHNHFLYSFTVSDGQLMAWGARLRRIGPNQFKDLGTGTITFAEENGAMHATLEMDGEAFFSGVRVQVPHLTAADLSAYAGQYRSAEVDATYNLSVHEGQLMLQLRWSPPITLEAVAPEEFESSELGTLVFRRDGSHHVIGLSLFDVNARGVNFTKAN